MMAFLPWHDRTRIVVFRWPAIGAGLAVALGIHIVLTTLGLGFAFVFNDGVPGDLAAGALLIWSGLVWAAASFVGGYVTAWVADSTKYVESLFHALTLWGTLTLVLLFLPPSTMGIDTSSTETLTSLSMFVSVAWFIAISGLLSLGTTVWGAIVGSHVVAEVETKAAETYQDRAA